MTDKFLKTVAGAGIASIILAFIIIVSQVAFEMLSAKSNLLLFAGIWTIFMAVFLAIMGIRFLVSFIVNYKSRIVVRENGRLEEEIVKDENKSNNI